MGSTPAPMLLTGSQYRESLRRLRPTVWVDGRRVESVADDPALAPGVNAVALTYDVAHRPGAEPLARAVEASSGLTVNRLLHIDRNADDLLAKLELVRLLCQETGCAMRYLSHDALNGLWQATWRIDMAAGRDPDAPGARHERFRRYLHRVQAQDLTLAVAMTDAKGDRSLHPHQQANADAYVHVVERRPDGIVISGTKAIVTGAPYCHEFLVMPCRNMGEADRDFAVACAVPVDAPGVTIVARRAGRPGEKAAKFSAKYGQSTGVVTFDRVFVPLDHVFLDGEHEHSLYLTQAYATHHRQSCVAARAGFGDLLIGAGALMIEANGLDADRTAHLRDAMVELIRITEGWYACGIAASTYHATDPSGCVMPDVVFSNIGKLMMTSQIYDLHRLAHHVSGGLVVALPGPDEDHNPATAGRLADVLRGRADIPYERRIETARFIEDLTVSDQAGWYSVITLHGGGSPDAMKREIWRHYPVASKVELVERLLDRGVLAEGGAATDRQPGRCCDEGCQPPERESIMRWSAMPLRRA